MGKKKRAAYVPPPVVTIRTLTVDFEARTVHLDGRTITVDARCFVIPILSGEAVFMPRGNMERIDWGPAANWDPGE